MQWQDKGFVIHARRFSDSLFILTLLTEAHGRHLGIIRIARGLGVCERGNLLSVRWRARLDDQLGRFEAELEAASGAALMDNPLALLVLESACVLLETLPERDKAPRIFAGFHALLSALSEPPATYADALAGFEIMLLREMGYGLPTEALPANALDAQTSGLAMLKITEAQLAKRVYAPLGKPLPPVRKRLLARLQRLNVS